jgi:hypothetical protein
MISWGRAGLASVVIAVSSSGPRLRVLDSPSLTVDAAMPQGVTVAAVEDLWTRHHAELNGRVGRLHCLSVRAHSGTGVSQRWLLADRVRSSTTRTAGASATSVPGTDRFALPDSAVLALIFIRPGLESPTGSGDLQSSSAPGPWATHFGTVTVRFLEVLSWQYRLRL